MNEVLQDFIEEFNLDLIINRPDEILLNGCRGGSDGLFTPRLGEEDDDFPNFNGHIVIEYFKKRGIDIHAWDHEKGLFSIERN